MQTAVDRYGAVEAGGTKIICAVGTGGGDLLVEARITTREPAGTLAEVLEFFRSAELASGAVRAIGVGSFGPLELRQDSPRYGFITNTPKPGWQNVDLRGILARGLGRPVGIDTDVNAAALAEQRWGDGRGLESLAYVTVGTGIGAGIIHGTRTVHGLMHPEIGHVRVIRHPADGFAGVCPFHGDCLEGLACGPAIIARSKRSLAEAPADDPAWVIEADYLGQLCAQLALMHSPQRIFFGGGVMQYRRLFEETAGRMRHWLGGYLPQDEVQAPEYVAPSGLGGAVGIKGALALALDAVARA